MIWYYLNNTERCDDIEFPSLGIVDNLQERANTVSFTIFSGTKPSENQDIFIYMGDEIAGFSGTTVTLAGKFERQCNKFYAGQRLQIRIADADEETVFVQSYDENTLTLELVSAPSGTVSIGDKIGEIIYGGIVSRVKDRNENSLTQLEYDVVTTDFKKIFNKKRVRDSWENVTARYIVNSFLNSTVNINRTLDALSYANATAIRAVWDEAGDGGNPNIDTSLFVEGDSSGEFPWVNSGGIATWEADGLPTTRDVSSILGVTSGNPTKGRLNIWLDTVDLSVITDIRVRFGSSSTDYIEVIIDNLKAGGNLVYYSEKLGTNIAVGTPDWTAVDYAQIRVNQTGDGSIKVNGLRIMDEKGFTMFDFVDTPVIDTYRSPNNAPFSILQALAGAYQFITFIDYERNVVFRPNGTSNAPIQFTDTSNNFTGLEIEVDQSQLGNRIIVYGGERISSSRYAQVVEGNGVFREWKLKSKFSGMLVSIDDNTSTDTMEVGTNTTTVVATAHGLVVNDHIVNRTRGELRQILTVPNPNSFTVETVTGQTNGDIFSKFDTFPTLGLEGITDETTVEYVQNSQEASVRASSSNPEILQAGIYIRFEYNERIPLELEYSDPTSVENLRALGLGDGIFDLDPIRDENITDTTTALLLAEAKIADYRNPIILGNVKTDQHGIKSGEILRITDTNRGINTDYVVQSVRYRLKAGEYKDYFEYQITFGTTLFGLIEFYQKLLKQGQALSFNEDAQVTNFVSPNEQIDFSDANFLTPENLAIDNEDIEFTDVNNLYTQESWAWEPSVGQSIETRWHLFFWS
jgi:hypothetical protein